MSLALWSHQRRCRNLNWFMTWKHEGKGFPFRRHFQVASCKSHVANISGGGVARLWERIPLCCPRDVSGIRRHNYCHSTVSQHCPRAEDANRESLSAKQQLGQGTAARHFTIRVQQIDSPTTQERRAAELERNPLNKALSARIAPNLFLGSSQLRYSDRLKGNFRWQRYRFICSFHFENLYVNEE